MEPTKGTTNVNCDDQFFHVFCHVDEGVIEKVEDRKFADFDKLLPQINSKNYRDDWQSVDIINKEGHTYLAPTQAKRALKVTRILFNRQLVWFRKMEGQKLD